MIRSWFSEGTFVTAVSMCIFRFYAPPFLPSLSPKRRAPDPRRPGYPKISPWIVSRPQVQIEAFGQRVNGRFAECSGHWKELCLSSPNQSRIGPYELELRAVNRVVLSRAPEVWYWENTAHDEANRQGVVLPSGFSS